MMLLHLFFSRQNTSDGPSFSLSLCRVTRRKEDRVFRSSAVALVASLLIAGTLRVSDRSDYAALWSQGS